MRDEHDEIAWMIASLVFFIFFGAAICTYRCVPGGEDIPIGSSMVIALGAAIISFRVSTPEHTLSSMLSSLGEAIREFKEGLHGNK